MRGQLNINQVMDRALTAAEQMKEMDQVKTDKIVKAAFEAGFDHRVQLAQLAHKETHLGVWKDKVIKNFIATKLVYEDIKDLKTVGVIASDKKAGLVEIAQPIGPIFAVTPVTNPTSTVLFKILIALKSRNPIIIRPHGAAKKCSTRAAQLCYDAALAAGAPEHCIQWIKHSTQEETVEMMKHRRTALIIATGSVSLVRGAYSSGNPALGIGPGNVPVYIGLSADIPFAVNQIFLSKTFDNGTICASEQALVVRRDHVEEITRLLKEKKAYFLSPEENKKLGTIAFNPVERVMRPEVIGQPATEIARVAGIRVPEETTLLIAPLKEVGLHEPLSLEILAPILAFYEVEDFEQGIKLCRQINLHGGLGHTVSIFSNEPDKINYFASVMNAGRILVNTPASHGALGGTYNTLQPSMTLGCGTGGKNITTDNITARHLLNIQRIAVRRIHQCVQEFDSSDFFDESVDADAFDKKCHNNLWPFDQSDF